MGIVPCRPLERLPQRSRQSSVRPARSWDPGLVGFPERKPFFSYVAGGDSDDFLEVAVGRGRF